MAKKLQQQELMEIFEELLDCFGPRHWWPGETPLEIAIGAILTQNVAWINVEKAINNLKAKNLLSVENLVQVSIEELGMLIRPTRYYNQKAARVKDFVGMVYQRYEGNLDLLFSQPTSNLRNQLLDIKGIGPETADSILLYAGQHLVFVVDAYTRRIFSRLGYLDENIGYEEMQAFFTSNLPGDIYLFNEYHALIVGLGNRVCLAQKPRCRNCPLVHRCSAFSLAN